jgi:hypothetical protein
MPLAGIEPADPASERLQTPTSDRAAAGIGNFLVPEAAVNSFGLDRDTVPSISVLADITLKFIFMFSLMCSIIQVTVF